MKKLSLFFVLLILVLASCTDVKYRVKLTESNLFMIVSGKPGFTFGDSVAVNLEGEYISLTQAKRATIVQVLTK